MQRSTPDKFLASPPVEQHGKLTQGEDTADNGGIYLSLAALTEDLKQEGKSLDDKDANSLTNLQRFFMAYATDWCDQVGPKRREPSS